MPHLVVLYTKNLDNETDMSSLCRRLADAMLAIRNRADKPVFRMGPRSHFASLFASRCIGLTLQIDEGQEVFDAKYSTIHPLFEGP
jgi:5-carboxymethyl-2-hydroxymuconate isomerase